MKFTVFWFGANRKGGILLMPQEVKSWMNGMTYRFQKISLSITIRYKFVTTHAKLTTLEIWMGQMITQWSHIVKYVNYGYQSNDKYSQ